jgi:RNA-directed DNA polymerase
MGFWPRDLGIVVNERRNLDRRTLDVLKATLTNCVRTGPAVQNRAGHPDFRAHLLGRLAYVAAVAPDKAVRLRVLFDRIDWSAWRAATGRGLST